jgi:hypothetical protein
MKMLHNRGIMSNTKQKDKILSRQHSMIMAYSTKGIESLRQRFFKKIRQDILQWGEEILDTARTYYPPVLDVSLSLDQKHESLKTSDLQMVEDRLYVPKANSTGPEFIIDLTQEWWPFRAQIVDQKIEQQIEQQIEQPTTQESNHKESINLEDQVQSLREALCGFYGKYLPSSGFALVLEFHNPHSFLVNSQSTHSMVNQEHQGLTHIWRVDARQKGTALKQVENTGDFYDQFGSYLDLQHGWRWLIQQHLHTKSMIISEVSPGYLIGVRAGDPTSDESPADREDKQIEEVFSRFDAERFDSLEFLNDPDNEALPFTSERYQEWLPKEYLSALENGDIELFTLSQAESFYQVIEELAERRKVELSWQHTKQTDESDTLVFTRGPLYIEHKFVYTYLWALHTGRFWHEAAQILFIYDLETLYAASDLYFKIIRLLNHGESITVEKGHILVVHDQTNVERIRVPILQWAGQGVFDHQNGAMQFLQMFGYQQGTWQSVQRRLDTCPICNKPANIIKALRPKKHASLLQKTATFQHDEVMGYYALSCPSHQLAIDWNKSSQIERAFQHQSHHVIDIKADQVIDNCRLIWAREIAGHLLSKDIQARLQEEGHQHAYVFYPDVIALTASPIAHYNLEDMRVYANHMARQWGANRMWPLNYNFSLHASLEVGQEIRH